MAHFQYGVFRSLLLVSVLAALAAGCGADAASSVESLASTQQAVAPPPSDAAYVFAFNATGSYDGSPQSSYNSSGATNHVRQLATGQYRIDFPNLGGHVGGDVQVTAFGSGSEHCKVASWRSLKSILQVNVNCFTVTGSPVNTQFTANYFWRNDTPGPEGGYVQGYDPTNPSYTVIGAYQWNSTGQPITIARASAGFYYVTFGGQETASAGGTYEVTAYGNDSAYCNTFSSDTIVVNCFDGTTHQLTDSQFTLSFSHKSPNNIRSYSYAHAFAPAPWSVGFLFGCFADGSPIGSTPPPGATIQYGTGFYQVTFPWMASLSKFPANVKVTAVRNGNGTNIGGTCKVQFWSTVGDDAYANVYCFDVNGNMADNAFMVTYSSSAYTIC